MTFEDPNSGQYPSPAYPPPVPIEYPQPAYPTPAAYPTYQTYPQPGYPTYAGYPMYAAPGLGYRPDPNRRPGVIMAAAVLAYVQAGLLMVAATTLFVGASATSAIADDLSSGDDGVTARFVLLGLANIVAATLYLIGGIKITNRERTGRTLMVIATAIVIVVGIVWLTWAGPIIIFWALLYWALGVVASSMLFGGSVTRWFAGGWAAGPPTAQYPSYQIPPGT